MEMQETVRLIYALRAAGWNEKQINDCFVFLGTGDEQFKPGTDKAE